MYKADVVVAARAVLKLWKQNQKCEHGRKKYSVLTAQRSRLEFSLEILFIRSLISASSPEPCRASKRLLIPGIGSSRRASKLNSSYGI